jgi:hypothetical protein
MWLYTISRDSALWIHNSTITFNTENNTKYRYQESLPDKHSSWKWRWLMMQGLLFADYSSSRISTTCSQCMCIQSHPAILWVYCIYRFCCNSYGKSNIVLYNNTTSVTMQPRKLICIFSFLLSSRHVSALAGHDQVLLFMVKLSNCIAYHFYLVLLSTKLCYSLIIFIKIVLFKIFVLKLHL